jgi:hypothetical protein
MLVYQLLCLNIRYQHYEAQVDPELAINETYRENVIDCRSYLNPRQNI